MENLQGLLYAVTVSASLSALGLGIDKLLLPAQFTSLKDHLTKWWVKVDDLNLRDLPKGWAVWALKLIQSIYGNKFFSLWFLVKVVLISSIMTVLAMLIGEWWWRGWDVDGFNRALSYFPRHKPLIVIPVNIVLDAASILVTFHAMKFMVAKSSNLKRILILSLDVVVAIALIMLCYAVSRGAEYADPSWGYFESNIRSMWGWLLSPHTIPSVDYANVLYSATNIIPSMIYVLLALALSVSLLSVRIVQFGAKQILALSVETEKSIFFYTGTVIGIANITLKLTMDLLK